VFVKCESGDHKLKNKFVFLFALMLLSGLPCAVHAQDDQLAQNFANIDNPLEIDGAEKAVTLRFEGKDPEKGTWHFFVKNQAYDEAQNTPLANELNAIAPAAGVQFNLEF